MSFSSINKFNLATDVRFSEDMLIVQLEDGRELSMPLKWFPRLRDATKKQLNDWRFIGKGEGMHWEELDEDISIEGLLN